MLRCRSVSVTVYLNLSLFQESLGEEVLRMSNDEIVSRTRLLDNEIKVSEKKSGSGVLNTFTVISFSVSVWIFVLETD